MAKVAFLGLGVMGYPMAGHLRAAGHQVTVYNRTAEKADKWVAEHGGDKAGTPAEAAKGCEFVFACVGDDADIRSVTTGPDGAFQAMDADAVFVDNTTASADVARELHAAARTAGLHFIDAPVSGGQAGAEGGKLTVMCGGDEAAYNRAEALMGCYGARVTHMGAAGAGQLTKMVNQICIAGLVQGLSEALNFGQNAGLDMDKVLGVVSGGAAQSGRWKIGARLWSGMNLILVLRLTGCAKIYRICLAEASQNGSQLPVTALVAQFYAALSARGFGRNDTSSLIRLLKNKHLSLA